MSFFFISLLLFFVFLGFLLLFWPLIGVLLAALDVLHRRFSCPGGNWSRFGGMGILIEPIDVSIGVFNCLVIQH